MPSSEVVGIPDQSLLVLFSSTAVRVFARLRVLLYLRIWLCLMSLLKGLDPLPRNWYRDPHSVELRNVICSVVVGARHHIWAEPPPRKLSGRPVLVVKAAVIDQHLVALFVLFRSQSVHLIEPIFVPLLRRFQLYLSSLRVFRFRVHIIKDAFASDKPHLTLMNVVQ